MSHVSDAHPQAFDPFGEPLAAGQTCPGLPVERAGYAETRRAAVAFWVLALLFVAGRVYLADRPAQPILAEAAAAVVAAPVTTLR
ncbi:hypothetical protein [uncultured Methylobacterium sp.]|uniref:hypothetical protein n=1 Tax=uncultured Methylobacterium sp. TaxID=157278 RepID=UPI0035CA96D5